MSTHSVNALLNQLADGQWRQLDGSQSARSVLANIGIVLEQRGAQYRLPERLELLDADVIKAQLSRPVADRLAGIDVHRVIDSTNAELLRNDIVLPGRSRVCLAEFQQTGRGRRGRTWLAPFGSALCLSLSWCFTRPVNEISALGLAVGVAVVRALRECGVQVVRLKWPNDLVVGSQKLGGILVETSSAGDNLTSVVVGIGLNLTLDDATRADIARLGGLAPVDLASLDTDAGEQRNRLAASVIDHTITMFNAFTERGFDCCREDWLALNALAGVEVDATTPNGTLTGTVVGIDHNGALLLDTGQETQRMLSADVTVRPT